jgi:hypothetical protein
VRQAAIAATTIVVAGVFLAIVAAVGADMTVTKLGLIGILFVAGVAAVAMGGPSTQRVSSATSA